MAKLNKDQEHERLKAMTTILKHQLMMMMIRDWNGKDFTNLDELSGMADDIIEVISEVGNEGEIKYGKTRSIK